jgi:TolA-binding protein
VQPPLTADDGVPTSSNECRKTSRSKYPVKDLKVKAQRIQETLAELRHIEEQELQELLEESEADAVLCLEYLDAVEERDEFASLLQPVEEEQRT